MAKRKPAPNKARAPKKKPTKAPKPKPARKTSNTKRGEKIKGPKQPALPGTEGVRNKALDKCCEGIGDERRTKNAAALEEKSIIANALKVMQQRNIHAYKHAGVELLMSPGTATLRVRLVKGDGDADVAGGETRSNNAEDTENPAIDDNTSGEDLNPEDDGGDGEGFEG